MAATTSDGELKKYIESTPRSRDLFEEGRKYLPGASTRVWWDPYPISWDRGEGCHTWDVDGVERIDFIGNNTALPLGHAHPAVVAAIIAQVQKGFSYNAPHETQVRLAKIVCERIPSVELVRFTNSGTEGTMKCVQAARAYTGRTKVAKVEGAYHGVYDAVGWVGSGDDPRRPIPVPKIPGIPQAMRDQIVMIPYNDAEASREIILENRDELGAVIVEPLMGSAGFIQAEPEFLNMLRDVTSQEGIVLIFDEVCALRAGPNGGQGHYGVFPDLAAFGKSVGGGLPIGAFGGKREIMDLFDPSQKEGTTISHAGSFNGNPVTMVCGIATFEQLTPEAYERLAALTERLREGIRAVCAEFEVPVQVTGLGSLFGVHFNEGPVRNYRDTLSKDRERTQQIFYGLLNEGIFPASGLNGAVSTPMTEEEIDAYVDALRTVLARNL